MLSAVAQEIFSAQATSAQSERDFSQAGLIRTTRTVVIFLKATKGKSQNRISLEQQRFLRNAKSESFLDFYLVYKYVYLKITR